MNTVTGLIGIAGIWLTMAMVPLIELLGLSAPQATFLRGLSGVVVIGIMSLFVRGLVTRPDRHTLRIVVLFVLATVCLFQAVQAWGANFSALFLDMALFVPLYFMWRSGKSIGLVTLGTIALALLGTMLALQVFAGGSLSLFGLAFSLGALVCNGLFIQYAGTATQSNWNKAFWMSVGLCVVAVPFIWNGFLIPEIEQSFSFVGLLVLFSLATGVLNFYSAFTALKNLSPVAVGVMVLGVTPTIMLSSYLLLGTQMDWLQIIGVGITLMAILIFGFTVRQDKT
jgi:drug/metabolite transporter (DMT)-like permease